jgi:hypothetical protein
MIAGPLLHSMKGKLLMGGPDAVIAEHARTDTTETSPRPISGLAMGASAMQRWTFAFKDGMKEFSTPAEPFSCEIILRLLHRFTNESTHVPLIGFHITFFVVGISKPGICSESVVIEEPVRRILEGVDCAGELDGGASFRLTFSPLDVFFTVYEAYILAPAAFFLMHRPIALKKYYIIARG